MDTYNFEEWLKKFANAHNLSLEEAKETSMAKIVKEEFRKRKEDRKCD